MSKLCFRLAAALLVCALSYQNANALVRGGYSTGVASPLFTPAWLSLRIGGGGEMNNVTVAPSDGTLVSAANTYGAYIRKNSGSCAGSDNGGWGTTYAAPCWEQLFTQTTAALTLAGVNNEQQGVNEIIACNNNTNDAYAWYNKTLWSISNLQAATTARLWNPISGVTTSISGNPGLVTWHTIACDPANPSVVYASSPAAGVKSSGNGLVTTPTFAAVTGIGTVGVVADVIAFDGAPSAPTQSCAQFTGSPTCTKHIMILVAGTGAFETYTGGATWTGTTGGPTAVPSQPCESGYCFILKTDQFGNFYAAIGDGKIYKYTPNGTAGGGTWAALTTPLTGNASGVFDIDPTSSSAGTLRIAAAYAGGNISISTNGGTSWCTASEMPFTASGAQPPWFANANQGQGTGGHNSTYIALKDMAFDASGNLHASAGIGNWSIASASVTCGATWQADSVGIENLVTNHIDSPPGMGPFAAEWDRAFYAALNPDVFPSHYWPDITYSTTFGPINAGWNLDWAGPSPTTLVGYGFFDNEISASSSNGGNTFAAWANLIGTGTTTPGGAVAASTSLNWIAAGGDNTATLRYTLNGATSAWGTSTITGVGTSITTFGGLGIPTAADRVTANAFCLYDSNKAIFSSVDGGATFTKRINGGTTNTGFYNHQLKAVPGVAGTFYLSGGNQGGGTTSYQLYKITSTTNECDTATLVNANFTNIYGFGFGAAKPGGANFPTIYYWGYNSGVPGLWEIDNGGTTATLLNVPTSQQTWPSNSGDFVQTVSGDNNVYGRVYVGFHGSGSTYIDKQDACPWVNFSGSIIPNVSLTGTVNLTAQHSGMVPVTQVNYYVDGSLIGSQTTGSGTPTTYTQSWVTGGVATGAHTLKVEAIGNGCVAGGPDSFSIPITTH